MNLPDLQEKQRRKGKGQCMMASLWNCIFVFVLCFCFLLYCCFSLLLFCIPGSLLMNSFDAQDEFLLSEPAESADNERKRENKEGGGTAQVGDGV